MNQLSRIDNQAIIFKSWKLPAEKSTSKAPLRTKKWQSAVIDSPFLSKKQPTGFFRWVDLIK
ncbi:hypothetical protein A3D78_06790 [Candidatus Gottesmanbacteria bacterium RIFCSPHIGHO2_02_FULL_39_14]|uniref:Uncharacterized protein n=1 Tax=Candidatus Gottesmanbacteria bacterium RIFCSPHIGHO2_02_FULL_39_14 TaxID=1798383 RepID=A0A1F6A320_9BACT|nr:MAG: hypothetical protein A3D78_06790 [Candidatus Gottesmanbacteria bacterium RIFCSPHIGHO2_02_FULL_39_14]